MQKIDYSTISQHSNVNNEMEAKNSDGICVGAVSNIQHELPSTSTVSIPSTTSLLSYLYLPGQTLSKLMGWSAEPGKFMDPLITKEPLTPSESHSLSISFSRFLYSKCPPNTININHLEMIDLLTILSTSERKILFEDISISLQNGSEIFNRNNLICVAITEKDNPNQMDPYISAFVFKGGVMRFFHQGYAASIHSFPKELKPKIIYTKLDSAEELMGCNFDDLLKKEKITLEDNALSSLHGLLVNNDNCVQMNFGIGGKIAPHISITDSELNLLKFILLNYKAQPKYLKLFKCFSLNEKYTGLKNSLL